MLSLKYKDNFWLWGQFWDRATSTWHWEPNKILPLVKKTIRHNQMKIYARKTGLFYCTFTDLQFADWDTKENLLFAD